MIGSAQAASLYGHEAFNNSLSPVSHAIAAEFPGVDPRKVNHLTKQIGDIVAAAATAGFNEGIRFQGEGEQS